MHWPTQNYKPPETFGRSCEALDPLRTKFRVYITWNSLGHFSIQGDSQEQVERVMKCINNTYRQLVARSFASQVTRKILLKPPTAANLLSTVNTTPYHHRQILPSTDSQRNVGVTPTLGGPPFETNQYLRKCAALFIENSRNEDIILGSIMKALDRVRWFRANIHLRIRLGTFVLTRYKKNAGVPFKLSEFEDMMKSGSMEGQITKRCVYREQ